MNGNNKQSANTTAKPRKPKAISDIFKGKKNNLLITLGLCAGIIFIILSFVVPKKTNYNDSGDGIRNNGADIKIEFSKTDTNMYIKEQEEKLCELLKRVKGISEPYVMITLESSSEYIYAAKEHIKENSSINGGNTTTQKEIQSDIILYSDVQKEESPILVKEIQPRLKGVAVVCKGVSNAETQLKIINLVATVLSLPTNRVYVISAD